MGTVIGIISGKGGTGKSTVSYCLGTAFSLLNKSVLVVDLDEGLRSLDVISGVESKIVNDISDTLEGQPLESAVYESPYYKNLFIMPAPANIGCLNYINLSSFKDRVKDLFNYIIFDFPAGIDHDKLSSLGESAEFIAVSNMDPISLRDAYAIANLLPETRKEPRLIINRFNIEFIKENIYENIDQMIDRSGLRLLGLVPGCLELSMLSVSHKITKKSRSMAAFTRIAKRIMGEEIRLPKPSKI